MKSDIARLAPLIDPLIFFYKYQAWKDKRDQPVET
jgi:hypothetical protein